MDYAGLGSFPRSDYPGPSTRASASSPLFLFSSLLVLLPRPYVRAHVRGGVTERPRRLGGEAEFYEHECLIKQLRDSLRARQDRHPITQAVKNGFVQPVPARTGSKDKEGRSLASGRVSPDAAALRRL